MTRCATTTQVLLTVILAYRVFSRPLWSLFGSFGIPCQCRFPVSCSEFAEFELKTNPSVWGALGRILKRLMSCHPLRIGREL